MKEHNKDKLYDKIIEDYFKNKKFVDEINSEIEHLREINEDFNGYSYAIDMHREKGNEDFTISFIQQLFKDIRDGKIKIE